MNMKKNLISCFHFTQQLVLIIHFDSSFKQNMQNDLTFVIALTKKKISCEGYYIYISKDTHT